jgi:xylulokinase
MKLIGIDVGTGGTRALLVDAEGKVCGSTVREHAAFRSAHPGWAEQDPEDWWQAAIQAIRGLLTGTGTAPEEIAAVGLSGQMHGAVLLDDTDRVLRPALIWCDQRTAAEAAWLTEQLGAERLIALTSNPALTNFTLTKLLWVRNHEPALWRQCRSFLLPKDYVRLRLTGERAMDVADASGTLLLDVAHRRWSTEMLAAVDMPETILPNARCGRGRRSSGGRARHGHCAPGRCQRHHRHLRSRLRRHRSPLSRPARSLAHLLSRSAGTLARHGRDPGSGSLVALVPRYVHLRER